MVVVEEQIEQPGKFQILVLSSFCSHDCWLDIFLLLYGRKWWPSWRPHGSGRSWRGRGRGARMDRPDVEGDDAGDGVHLQVELRR